MDRAEVESVQRDGASLAYAARAVTLEMFPRSNCLSAKNMLYII